MKTIQTERLILRPFTYEDTMAVHEYASNEEVVKYMLFGPNTLEDTKNYLEYVIEKLYTADPMRVFEYAIEYDGVVVGAVQMAVKKDNTIGEMGWILNPKYHRLGIMTEAASEVIKILRNDLSLQNVIATCDERNTASSKLMEKLGMKLIKVRKGVRQEKKTGLYEFDELTYGLSELTE